MTYAPKDGPDPRSTHGRGYMVSPDSKPSSDPVELQSPPSPTVRRGFWSANAGAMIVSLVALAAGILLLLSIRDSGWSGKSGMWTYFGIGAGPILLVFGVTIPLVRFWQHMRDEEEAAKAKETDG